MDGWMFFLIQILWTLMCLYWCPHRDPPLTLIQNETKVKDTCAAKPDLQHEIHEMWQGQEQRGLHTKWENTITHNTHVSATFVFQ